jgi:hypothetical protein
MAGSLAGGCKSAKTEIAVTIGVDADASHRPDHVLLLWRGPGGRDFAQPITMLNPPGSSVLATVLVELDDSAEGDRLVVAKGLNKMEMTVSGAGAYAPWKPHQRWEIRLDLTTWVDPDGDDLPTGLDPCPDVRGTVCPAPAVDAGDGDAGDGDAADAGADEDAGAGDDAADAAEVDAGAGDDAADAGEVDAPTPDAAPDARRDTRRAGG